MVCRIYRWACRLWGPFHEGERITLSAAAHLRATAGLPWWRDRIDGLALFFFSDHQHCQSAFQRGRITTDAKGPRK